MHTQVFAVSYIFKIIGVALSGVFVHASWFKTKEIHFLGKDKHCTRNEK